MKNLFPLLIVAGIGFYLYNKSKQLPGTIPDVISDPGYPDGYYPPPPPVNPDGKFKLLY
ncbi:MAG: hypothetical protein M3Q56_11400 [Bacteroidota bacterium]|nr:hypothetical protein [Bacteroidota bacterium]